jgi:hypothetical protein
MSSGVYSLRKRGFDTIGPDSLDFLERNICFFSSKSLKSYFGDGIGESSRCLGVGPESDCGGRETSIAAVKGP